MSRPPLAMAVAVALAVLVVDLIKGDSLQDSILSAVIIAVLGFAFLWVVREIEVRTKRPK